MLKKFASVLAVLAIVAVAGVAVANAQTASVQSLQAQIQALQAMLAQLQGGAAAAPAASATFTRDLTVGSKGADVSALQQMLIDAGDLNIAAPTASFGPLTKKALATYQKDNNITPASGYFGPKTRAFVAAMATPAPTATPVVTGVPGATVTPAPVLNDGTDGSVMASLQSSPANGTVMKKGDAQNVIAYKFKATAGNVAVTRFDARFDVRPWLYFGEAQLIDDSGNVVADKKGLSQSDFTELTANTDYLLRFDGMNYVVTPSADKTLTLRLFALGTSDRTAGTININANTGNTSNARTTNGKGYTDTVSVNGNRTISFQSASTGNLIVSLDGSSAPAGIVTVSQNGETDPALAVIKLVAENQDVTLNTLKLKLNMTDSDAVTGLDLFDAAGNKIASADQAVNGATSTFSSLNLKVPQGTSNAVLLTVKARVPGQGNPVIYADGTTVSITVYPDTTSVSGTDALFNTATVGGSVFVSNTQSLYYKGVSFAFNSAAFSVAGNTNAGTPGSYGTGEIKFAVTATGGYDVYLLKGVAASSSPMGVPGYGLLYATSTSVANASTTVSGTLTNLDGDSNTVKTNSYFIPAGATRHFDFSFTTNNSAAASTFAEVDVTGFGWNTSDSLTAAQLYTANLTSYKTSSLYHKGAY